MVRRRIGIAFVVLVILLGAFLVYQQQAQEQQAAQEQQQQDQANQAAEQLIQQQQRQNQNFLGQTIPVLLDPGQGKPLGAEYLFAGTNVTLQLEATGNYTGQGFFGSVCYSLATPSGTWLVGNGKSQLSCVDGAYYKYRFIAPETGYYSLYAQSPSSGNYQLPIDVTATFTRN